MNIETQEIVLDPADNLRLLSLCGPFDNNIKQLEQRIGVVIHRRDNTFKLIGQHRCIDAAVDLLQALYVETSPKNGGIKDISPEDVHLAIKSHPYAKIVSTPPDQMPSEPVLPKENGNTLGYKEISVKTKRGLIRPRTPNQAAYLNNISQHDITFGVGPAGTGKTWLAVAMAVEALERQSVRRILLTRPAVEAGEKLGFLPGDLHQKVDPYLRPLYDALCDMLGLERVEKLMERNWIEVAPLAYMRGRTLNDAFIILDESQNTTIEQMKMFLTRIGFNAKVVITGDITQVDLPSHVKSGLRHVIEVLSDIEEISFNFFDQQDIVRHPIVSRIVNAYEKWDNQQQKEVGKDVKVPSQEKKKPTRRKKITEKLDSASDTPDVTKN